MTRVLPGTFDSLMDLYERNYMLMRRLAPVLPEAGVELCSQVDNGLDLHLQVLNRFRYTSDLMLTYRFATDGTHTEPDMFIRVYHDARAAEVMAAHLRRWPAFDQLSADAPQLHLRWRVNRFLYKWLRYCIHQNHSFA